MSKHLFFYKYCMHRPSLSPLPSIFIPSPLSPLLTSPPLSPLSFPPLPSLPSPPLPSLHSALPVIQATTPVYTEDRTAHLSCSVNTSATLWWTFANNTVIPNRGRYSIVVTKRNTTLVIDMVTAQDTGEYVCRAGNSVGSDQTTVDLEGE